MRQGVGGRRAVSRAQFLPGDGAVMVEIKRDGGLKVGQRDVPLASDAVGVEYEAEITFAGVVRSNIASECKNREQARGQPEAGRNVPGRLQVEATSRTAPRNCGSLC